MNISIGKLEIIRIKFEIKKACVFPHNPEVCIAYKMKVHKIKRIQINALKQNLPRRRKSEEGFNNLINNR